MDKEEAQQYLTSLLNKNLRILATDGRIFWGQFKCTDPDRNVILAHAYEYRQPSAQKQAEAAQNAGPNASTVMVNLTSRYLGLIVIPGRYIVKMEVEEFASQLRS